MATNLTEDKRKQLDSIVQKMIQNKEPDESIRFVVDDFKKKYTVVAKPEEAKKDFLTKAGDIVNKIFPGKQVGEAIGTLAGYGITAGKEKLGLAPPGSTEAYNLDAPTPLQVGADVAKGALLVGAPQLPVAGSILGKAAQFGALGGASGALDPLAEGKGTEDVLQGAKKGALTGAVVGGALGVAEKGLTKLSDLIGKTGDKIQFSVIKPTQADIKDGFSIETVKKYNLGGSLKKSFAKTDSVLDDLSKQLNEKLAATDTAVDLNKVYVNTTKKLLGNKLESFGANTQLEGAIEKLKNEIVNVSGKNGLVSIPEAQIVKRASGHFGAWNYGVPTPEATASQKVYNTFYNELKTTIEKSSPEGVREINKEISKLIPVMNALIRRIPVAERNSAISLTDIITLSAAALEPRALSLSLLNFASKSGSVGRVLSKTPDLGGIVKKAEPIAKGLIAK